MTPQRKPGETLQFCEIQIGIDSNTDINQNGFRKRVTFNYAYAI